MEIITRQEAIAQGLALYYTGKPCKRGHIAERFMSADCRECSRLRSKIYRSENREAILQQNKVDYVKNREAILAERKVYYAENSEAKRQQKKVYRSENREVINQRSKEYSKAHRGTCNAISAKRRARKLDQTPPDANLDTIAQIYADVRFCEELLGEKCHVHHIKQLSHGGPHHEDNLVIVTRRQHQQMHAIGYTYTNVFEGGSSHGANTQRISD